MAKLVIVLDPGHVSGINVGAIEDYIEGDVMYKLCKLEQIALDKRGIKAVITHKPKQEVELYHRGQKAVKQASNGARVVFISEHTGAVNGGGVEVVRSHYLPNSEELGSKLAEATAQAMGITNNGVHSKTGNNGDYYGVLRGAVNGATTNSKAREADVEGAYIVFNGYHTDATTCEWLLNEDNLKALAEAKSQAIADYFNIE